MAVIFEKQPVWNWAHTSVCRYKNLHNLPHWHLEHEIIYVQEGRADLTVNNILLQMSMGMCAFVNGGELHYIKSDSDSIVSIIKIDEAYVRDIISQKKLLSPVLNGDYNIGKIISELSDELKNGKEYCTIISDSIITRLAAEIFRNEAFRESKSDSLNANQRDKKLLEYIAGNCADITFDDAARHINFSKAYFSKYFCRLSGMTFTHYLNMLKVSSAADMILQRRMDMTEISIACGFGTIRNFNRVFKQITGYTPKHLPRDFALIYNAGAVPVAGFDPTLNCTEILYE
ncbi:MAG: helix-turn-helix domain-containing protein [Acutalibacteraceae bacterium]